jgi:hypothetical protein
MFFQSKIENQQKISKKLNSIKRCQLFSCAGVLREDQNALLASRFLSADLWNRFFSIRLLSAGTTRAFTILSVKISH